LRQVGSMGLLEIFSGMTWFTYDILDAACTWCRSLSWVDAPISKLQGALAVKTAHNYALSERVVPVDSCTSPLWVTD
jgi:hypothetical protein